MTRRFGHALCGLIAVLVLFAAATQASESNVPKPCRSAALPRAVCAVIYHAAPAAGVKERWAVSRQLASLVQRESSARFNAVNPKSGACGIGEMLPCAKYGPGSCWPAPHKQAVCLLRYIKGRYHNPRAAWLHETTKGWY